MQCWPNEEQGHLPGWRKISGGAGSGLEVWEFKWDENGMHWTEEFNRTGLLRMYPHMIAEKLKEGKRVQ